MKIIAIDPGAHCGIAIRKEDGNATALMIHNNIDKVMDLIIEEHPEVLVVEQFATGGRMSAYGHETVEIVGIVRGLAHILGAKFVKHTPQIRYAFMDEAYKLTGKNKTKIQSHEVDAMAHLLSYEYWSTRD